MLLTLITNIEDKLKQSLREMRSVIIAYSGGVDSSYLMDVANEVLGKKSLAAMSFYPSVAQDDRNDAVNLAKSKSWKKKIMSKMILIDAFSVKMNFMEH